MELAAEIASAAALRLLLGTAIGDCRTPAYREQRFIT
jgi:hypothetical protein